MNLRPLLRIMVWVLPTLALVLVGQKLGAPASARPTAAREDDGQRSAPASRPEQRVAWTTSRMAGTPDPPLPYTIEPAFPKLKFLLPVVMAPAPGSDRLFVGELKGKIYSFPNDPACDHADLTLDLAKIQPSLTMFYGLTFHPRFAENRFVYVCYALKDGLPDGTRVARFEVSRSDPPHIEPESEQVIITWLAGGHNGGCLAFGPDGCLYISAGDGAGPSPPDPLNTGQDLSDLLSSILRIDVDHPEAGRPYRIPPDNPFVHTPGARPEIWAFGFRNPWKMSFDRAAGTLWVGDVGWELWEMVDRVERGGNYGWSIVEGHQPVHPEGKRGPGQILPPTIEHPHSEAASITGGYVYRGKRLPELAGTYLYGDFQTGKIWGLKHDGQQVTWHRELANTPLELVAFGEDSAGEVHAIDHERTRQIYRLVPNPAARANTDFPRKLSQTGLFSSTADLRPAPGVIPYAIHAELWSDHAQAERLLAVPGSLRIEIDDRGYWHLPEGSVLARTVSLEMERGNARSRRRLETQVLHREGESWRPYTYLWNDEQTDATLADAQGSSRTLTVRDSQAPGGQRVQNYRFHARAECLLCHNPWVEKQTTMFGPQSASPLAVTTEQLNRESDHGGRVANQVEALAQMGMFTKPLGKPVDKLPRFANPYEDSADLDRRARAYLHVNCSHCHQFNAGGAATIVLASSVSRDEMKAVGERPSQGTFGISDARILAPGDPYGSVLFYRIAKMGAGRMPRVGSNLVDERALDLFQRWIAGMEPPGDFGGADHRGLLPLIDSFQDDSSTPDQRARLIREQLNSTRSALRLMRLLDRFEGRPAEPLRKEVIAIAKSDPRVEVRDLFERFIPESERIKRLGDVVDPAAILALKGDAQRGRAVFLSDTAAQCKSCHQLEGAGVNLGPDLSKVGSKYTRPALLEQILEPSRTIDPLYTMYLVETKAGEVHTGLIAERTEKQVVLRDAQNRTIRIPAGDIERLVPQASSLMPELLLRDMTAQQVADLVEYLGSLR